METNEVARNNYIMYGGEKKSVDDIWGLQGPVVTDFEKGVAIPLSSQGVEGVGEGAQPGLVSEADVISGDIAAAEMYLAAQTTPEGLQSNAL